MRAAKRRHGVPRITPLIAGRSHGKARLMARYEKPAPDPVAELVERFGKAVA